MTTVLVPLESTCGFSFDNCLRNQFLVEKGLQAPKPVKTGTTISGVVFQGGVVLGADTRATDDTIVADKDCTKIHYISKNMFCCGAGTAADTFQMTALISSNLELHRLYSGREVPVVVAVRMLKQRLFRYQGHVGAALVLGGVDKNGPHLYCIHPHGSTDMLPYTCMGSGSLAAMAVLERGWKEDLSEAEAKTLVRDSIAAGVLNDLGSGSNVDLCVIRKGTTEYIRAFENIGIKGQKHRQYKYMEGTTDTLNTKVIPLHVDKEIIRQVTGVGADTMDTS